MKTLNESQMESVSGGKVPAGAGMGGGMGGIGGAMGNRTNDLAKDAAGRIAKGYAERNRGQISRDSCTGQARDRNRGGNRGGGRSRVICTHFYRKGMIEPKVWRADLEFTQKNLNETTVRGYHFWAIPYVELMRRRPLAEKVMYPLAKYRAIELAYQMGVIEKGSLRGKLIRVALEPLCFVVGMFCKQKNWDHLWTTSG